MKKQILGTVSGVLFALVSIVSSQYMSTENASAKALAGGDRYDTALCYSNGNYGVRCSTPTPMGPCGTSVSCTY